MINSSRSKRPRSVTITIIGVFLFGTWNVGRAIALFQQSDYLFDLGIIPNPRLQMFIAMGWAVLFLGLMAALWQKRPFTRWATPVIFTAYGLFDIIWQALFVKISIGSSTWLSSILFYPGLIIFSVWALNRPAAKLYFEEG